MSIGDSSLNAGESFTLSSVVRNAGDRPSTATTLRYYRSTDSTISTSDTQVGTDAVGALSRQATSAESITLTAPAAMVMAIRTRYVQPEGRSNPEANARCSIPKELPMQA